MSPDFESVCDKKNSECRIDTLFRINRAWILEFDEKDQAQHPFNLSFYLLQKKLSNFKRILKSVIIQQFNTMTILILNIYVMWSKEISLDFILKKLDPSILILFWSLVWNWKCKSLNFWWKSIKFVILQFSVLLNSQLNEKFCSLFITPGPIHFCFSQNNIPEAGGVQQMLHTTHLHTLFCTPVHSVSKC